MLSNSRRLRGAGFIALCATHVIACSSGDDGPGAANGGGAGMAGTLGASGRTGAGGSTAGAGMSGSAGMTGSSGTTGATGGAGMTGAAGTTGGAGTTGAAGTMGGGAPGAGSGAGGSTGGGDIGGRGGATTAGASGAGAGGMGGASGSAGNAAGGAGVAGASTCTGYVVSLSANGSGTASDSAKARVEIDLTSDLPLASATRTVELWAYMKMSDWTANTNTLFFYGPFPSARNADGFGLDFGGSNGTTGTIDPFTNAIFDNDNQASGVTTTASQWVHFAMTWDGTTVRAYVNGVVRSEKDAGSNAQKTLMTGRSVFTLGGYPGENAYFNGLFDELRVWSVARSGAEIMAAMNQALAGNETGLVGYWKFEETSGTMAADSVTAAGHVAHAGTLMAANSGGTPTFVLPPTPSPIMCP